MILCLSKGKKRQIIRNSLFYVQKSFSFLAFLAGTLRGLKIPHFFPCAVFYFSATSLAALGSSRKLGVVISFDAFELLGRSLKIRTYLHTMLALN